MPPRDVQLMIADDVFLLGDIRLLMTFSLLADARRG
jgi:hypothetical protein